MAFCAPQCLPVYKPRGSSFSLSCALSRPQNKAEDEVSTLTPDESFATWAKANMVDMSSLALASWEPQKLGMNASSRGMTATAPLKKGNRLITVSCQSTLQVTSLDGKKSPIPHQISGETWQRLPWFARLALLLLDAKLDPKSNMKLWIQKLPKSFDTPFHWSERELLELQNRKMIQSVHEQRKLYRKLYNDINGNADNLLARKLKYDDFVWAVECIRSRAFSGPLEVAPFKERARLFLFIIANTIAWPAINILSWENALNGSFHSSVGFISADSLTCPTL